MAVEREEGRSVQVMAGVDRRRQILSMEEEYEYYDCEAATEWMIM